MAVIREFPHPRARRVLIPRIAPRDTIVLEIEFENLEECEEYWAAFFARPEFAEVLEEWWDMTESGGSDEIWTLVE